MKLFNFFRSPLTFIALAILSFDLHASTKSEDSDPRQNLSTLSKTAKRALGESPELLEITNEEAEANASKPVILVIDDAPLVPRVFKRFFSKLRGDHEDYTLVFAKTGDEGIELYDHHHPILTFIDFNLGTEITGEVIANHIRQSAEDPGILVGISDDPESNKKIDADFHIPKLKNIQLLQEVLTSVLGENV